MGQHHKFACSQCALTATVSGGRDRGMELGTVTVWCPDCRALKDAVIEHYSLGSTESTTQPPCCPTCQNTRVHPWQERDPCPACDAPVRNRGLAALWD